MVGGNPIQGWLCEGFTDIVFMFPIGSESPNSKSNMFDIHNLEQQWVQTQYECFFSVLIKTYHNKTDKEKTWAVISFALGSAFLFVLFFVFF